MLDITSIKKRDGRIVPFEKDRITKAIFNAAQSVGGTDKQTSDGLASLAFDELQKQFGASDIPTVEQIQDTVEKVLIENGHAKTAKAYILYRERHNQMRAMKDTFVDVQGTIDEYLMQTDWRVKENSNEAYSFSGLLLHTAGKVIANYALNRIYTPAIADAHRKGYFHIHDLSHGFIAYCAGWSLKDLLQKGFGGVANKVDAKPAKHMSVVVHQMVNFIGCLQMEFAGAQAFSSVDTLLAPFVRADNLNYKQVKQHMQQLVFSLNIPSRWGSQYPFSNLTFDWVVPDDMKDTPAVVGGKELDTTYGDYQAEMDMINKAFLEVMLEGDANGRIFSFPIPTYNLTKDFDWNSENANILFEGAAKYGLPYFQNYIGSNLQPNSIRAMCCRLNMDTTQLMNRPGGMWSMGDSTGSIGVVTINLNRLAYENKTKEVFHNKLRHYMILAKESLETKRAIINRNLEAGLMPYTKAYLGHFRNHFSTIGLCGMNEACLNMLGKSIAEPEGKQFAMDTLNFMREVITQFQQETGNLYNLEATPAESASYRLAMLDKKTYPEIITAGEEAPYLTNSSHLPVNHTQDAFEAVEHQSDIQALYNGGTIFHTFLGEKVSSGEACKQLVKKIAENSRLPYFSITPTFSICKNHGYLKGKQASCPECGETTEIYSRIVGYYRPLKNWNKGKTEEFKFREEFQENTTLSGSSVQKVAIRSNGSTEVQNEPQNPSSSEVQELSASDSTSSEKDTNSSTETTNSESTSNSSDTTNSESTSNSSDTTNSETPSETSAESSQETTNTETPSTESSTETSEESKQHYKEDPNSEISGGNYERRF